MGVLSHRTEFFFFEMLLEFAESFLASTNVTIGSFGNKVISRKYMTEKRSTFTTEFPFLQIVRYLLACLETLYMSSRSPT